MDALKRHHLSRCRKRIYLSKIITASTEIIEKDPTEFTESGIVSLADWLKQPNHKKEILSDVDAKIIALIEEIIELESEILETRNTRNHPTTISTRDSSLMPEYGIFRNNWLICRND